MIKTEPTGTETAILKAARAVFLRRGFEATSMGDIAAEAAISRPALHYHFRTKEALFRAILAEAAGLLFPVIADIIKARAPLEAKAERIVDRYHELLLENPHLPHFVLHEAQREPGALLALVRGQPGAEVFFAFVEREIASRLRGGKGEHRLALFISVAYPLLFFPFLAKPMLDLTLFEGDPLAFRRFVLEERKPLMMRLVLSLLGLRRGRSKKAKPAQKRPVRKTP